MNVRASKDWSQLRYAVGQIEWSIYPSNRVQMKSQRSKKNSNREICSSEKHEEVTSYMFVTATVRPTQQQSEPGKMPTKNQTISVMIYHLPLCLTSLAPTVGGRWILQCANIVIDNTDLKSLAYYVSVLEVMQHLALPPYRHIEESRPPVLQTQKYWP